jgi:glycosyltransferase involved in cell wall biosynthesis
MEVALTPENLIAAGACGLLFITLTNVLWWPRVRLASAAGPGLVSVLIPARNEEANLGACLAAVLQQGVTVGEILLYNDHSTDNTAQVIQQVAARDGRVRALAPQPLPVGWCGKNFACAQLAQAARGPWLLFLDADALLQAGAVASMVAEAQRRRLTMLSCWPGLVLVSFWEKALMPMLNTVVFSVFPGVLSLVRGEASLGLAHGACLLFERATYEKLGGHAAVKEQIFEDTRLAQLWRTRGERSLGLDGQAIVRVRMYQSLAEIWAGFQKNFYPAFQHEFSFWVFWLLHAALFCAPFAMYALTRRPAYGLAAAAILLLRWLLALRFGQPQWSVLLQPFSEALLLALGLSSWWRCKSGRGVNWKGREYLKVRAS